MPRDTFLSSVLIDSDEGFGFSEDLIVEVERLPRPALGFPEMPFWN
jgi:hypothetical protein